MIFDLDGSEIVMESPKERAEMTLATSYFDMMKKRKPDIERKAGCLKALVCSIPFGSVDRYFDPMAGCGFTARLLEKELKPRHLHLNDLSKECVKVLQANFPKAKITRKDIWQYEGWKDFDLMLFDPNTFSLRHWDMWEPFLSRAKKHCERIWITDTTSFAFKFGTRCFGCETLNEYFELLGEQMKDIGLYLEAASVYPGMANASIVCFRRKAVRRKWKLVEAVPLTLTSESEQRKHSRFGLERSTT